MNINSVFFVSFLLLFSCMKEPKVVAEISIENTLNVDRDFETVEIAIDNFSSEEQGLMEVFDGDTKIVSQLVDVDFDGKKDVILFQPTIKAMATKHYRLMLSTHKKDTTIAYCYSRFVPERTDDYAWENNKVAFRAFGPAAQNMKENGVKGGTLTSGIDAWLKRVEYPIINKWYRKHTLKQGSYHKDTGEGLDNFHVGVSRGIGGVAVKVDSTYYSSKNFISYKRITTGPIRTSFVLQYKSWSANGHMINETKKIFLDYGQNLSRFEIDIQGINKVAVGLTLHKNEGETKIDLENHFVSYWEPIGDSELGLSIVTKKDYFIDADKYITAIKDQSHLYANMNVVEGKVTYYAGFVWKKSKQLSTHNAWQNYLTHFSKVIENPLIVRLTSKNNS